MSKFKLFTLIELLVVILILLILSSLIAPSFQKVMAHSKTLVCKKNLNMTFTAISIYSDDYAGILPGICKGSAPATYTDNYRRREDKQPASWNQILPFYLSYVVESAPYKEEGPTSVGQKKSKRIIPFLNCPSINDLREVEDSMTESQFNIGQGSNGTPPMGSAAKLREDRTIRKQQKLPVSLASIVSPISERCLIDSKFQDVFGVHEEILENELFYDGRVESIENFELESE